MMRAVRHPPARTDTQRAVDGVLLLDKSAGMTSHTAVRRVRGLLQARKAGHTGTLDPLATGLLPVCLGEATKFSHALLNANKSYLATIRLGLTTTTGDLEGATTAQAPVDITEAQARTVLGQFVGEILQVPPMYSAIKHGGRPLYKLARAGKELPRAPRRVVVHELRFMRFSPPELEVSITCSKGTYVRVLAEDIGRELGCGGCLAGLRRTAVGELSAATGSITLERLETLTPQERFGLLLPPDALLSSLPRLDLDAGNADRLKQGQPVDAHDSAIVGLARIYGPGSEFLGMAEIIEPGRIVPRRLRSQPLRPVQRARSIG